MRSATTAHAGLHLDRRQGPEGVLNREPGGILKRKRVQRFGVTYAGLFANWRICDYGLENGLKPKPAELRP